jgi:hypothetical protein
MTVQEYREFWAAVAEERLLELRLLRANVTANRSIIKTVLREMRHAQSCVGQAEVILTGRERGMGDV